MEDDSSSPAFLITPRSSTSYLPRSSTFSSLRRSWIVGISLIPLLFSIDCSAADWSTGDRTHGVCSCFVPSTNSISFPHLASKESPSCRVDQLQVERQKVSIQNSRWKSTTSYFHQMARRYYQCHRLISTSIFSGPPSNQKSLVNFQTALCIVPPTRTWDRLQRARHQARDPSFHEWPPAIRLFHPFSTQFSADSAESDDDNGRPQNHMAFELANFVEELELEPFDVTLDQWTILPNLEAIQAEYLASQLLPNSAESGEYDGADGNSMDGAFGNDSGVTTEEEIQQLIDREEIIGKEKKKKRDRKLAAQRGQSPKGETGRNLEEPRILDDDPLLPSAPSEAATSARKRKSNRSKDTTDEESHEYTTSPRQILKQQQEQYEEFNGPCILCLEPDASSSELLCDLRESLEDVIFPGNQSPSQFSPSSIYSWAIPRKDDKAGSSNMFDSQPYRPLIPISAFGSVTEAMTVARRLKGLWEPLTFPVTELHIMSCREDEDIEDMWMRPNLAATTAASSSSSSPSTNTAMESESSVAPFGCNARIKLFEEGIEELGEKTSDEISTEEMLQLLLDEGEAGGMDLTSDYTILDEEEEEPTSSVLEWLDDDDDWDEGTRVVIGRTTFLTGDQRTYKGMPATSTVDAKDRLLGGGSGAASLGGVGGGSGLGDGEGFVNGWSVSGAARRRTTVGRATSVFRDGEFGHREADWSPFSVRERSRRRKAQPHKSVFKRNTEEEESDDE